MRLASVSVYNRSLLPYQRIPSPYPGVACLEFQEESISPINPISYILFGGTSESTYYTELDGPDIWGPRCPSPHHSHYVGSAFRSAASPFSAKDRGQFERP